MSSRISSAGRSRPRQKEVIAGTPLLRPTTSSSTHPRLPSSSSLLSTLPKSRPGSAAPRPTSAMQRMGLNPLDEDETNKYAPCGVCIDECSCSVNYASFGLGVFPDNTAAHHESHVGILLRQLRPSSQLDADLQKHVTNTLNETCPALTTAFESRRKEAGSLSSNTTSSKPLLNRPTTAYVHATPSSHISSSSLQSTVAPSRSSTATLHNGAPHPCHPAPSLSAASTSLSATLLVQSAPPLTLPFPSTSTTTLPMSNALSLAPSARTLLPSSTVATFSSSSFSSSSPTSSSSSLAAPPPRSPRRVSRARQPLLAALVAARHTHTAAQHTDATLHHTATTTTDAHNTRQMRTMELDRTHLTSVVESESGPQRAGPHGAGVNGDHAGAGIGVKNGAGEGADKEEGMNMGLGIRLHLHKKIPNLTDVSPSPLFAASMSASTSFSCPATRPFGITPFRAHTNTSANTSVSTDAATDNVHINTSSSTAGMGSNITNDCEMSVATAEAGEHTHPNTHTAPCSVSVPSFLPPNPLSVTISPSTPTTHTPVPTVTPLPTHTRPLLTRNRDKHTSDANSEKYSGNAKTHSDIPESTRSRKPPVPSSTRSSQGKFPLPSTKSGSNPSFPSSSRTPYPSQTPKFRKNNFSRKIHTPKIPEEEVLTAIRNLDVVPHKSIRKDAVYHMSDHDRDQWGLFLQRQLLSTLEEPIFGTDAAEDRVKVEVEVVGGGAAEEQGSVDAKESPGECEGKAGEAEEEQGGARAREVEVERKSPAQAAQVALRTGASAARDVGLAIDVKVADVEEDDAIAIGKNKALDKIFPEKTELSPNRLTQKTISPHAQLGIIEEEKLFPENPNKNSEYLSRKRIGGLWASGKSGKYVAAFTQGDGVFRKAYGIGVRQESHLGEDSDKAHNDSAHDNESLEKCVEVGILDDPEDAGMLLPAPLEFWPDFDTISSSSDEPHPDSPLPEKEPLIVLNSLLENSKIGRNSGSEKHSKQFSRSKSPRYRSLPTPSSSALLSPPSPLSPAASPALSPSMSAAHTRTAGSHTGPGVTPSSSGKHHFRRNTPRDSENNAKHPENRLSPQNASKSRKNTPIPDHILPPAPPVNVKEMIQTYATGIIKQNHIALPEKSKDSVSNLAFLNASGKIPRSAKKWKPKTRYTNEEADPSDMSPTLSKNNANNSEITDTDSEKISPEKARMLAAWQADLYQSDRFTAIAKEELEVRVRAVQEIIEKDDEGSVFLTHISEPLGKNTLLKNPNSSIVREKKRSPLSPTSPPAQNRFWAKTPKSMDKALESQKKEMSSAQSPKKSSSSVGEPLGPPTTAEILGIKQKKPKTRNPESTDTFIFPSSSSESEDSEPDPEKLLARMPKHPPFPRPKAANVQIIQVLGKNVVLGGRNNLSRAERFPSPPRPADPLTATVPLGNGASISGANMSLGSAVCGGTVLGSVRQSLGGGARPHSAGPRMKIPIDPVCRVAPIPRNPEKHISGPVLGSSSRPTDRPYLPVEVAYEGRTDGVKQFQYGAKTVYIGHAGPPPNAYAAAAFSSVTSEKIRKSIGFSFGNSERFRELRRDDSRTQQVPVFDGSYGGGSRKGTFAVPHGVGVDSASAGGGVTGKRRDKKKRLITDDSESDHGDDGLDDNDDKLTGVVSQPFTSTGPHRHLYEAYLPTASSSSAFTATSTPIPTSTSASTTTSTSTSIDATIPVYPRASAAHEAVAAAANAQNAADAGEDTTYRPPGAVHTVTTTGCPSQTIARVAGGVKEATKESVPAATAPTSTSTSTLTPAATVATHTVKRVAVDAHGLQMVDKPNVDMVGVQDEGIIQDNDLFYHDSAQHAKRRPLSSNTQRPHTAQCPDAAQRRDDTQRQEDVAQQSQSTQKNARQRPASAVQHPTHVTQRPLHTNQRPASAMQRPQYTTQRRETVPSASSNQHPLSATQRPKSAVQRPLDPSITTQRLYHSLRGIVDVNPYRAAVGGNSGVVIPRIPRFGGRVCGAREDMVRRVEEGEAARRARGRMGGACGGGQRKQPVEKGGNSDGESGGAQPLYPLALPLPRSQPQPPSHPCSPPSSPSTPSPSQPRSLPTQLSPSSPLSAASLLYREVPASSPPQSGEVAPQREEPPSSSPSSSSSASAAHGETPPSPLLRLGVSQVLSEVSLPLPRPLLPSPSPPSSPATALASTSTSTSGSGPRASSPSPFRGHTSTYTRARVESPTHTRTPSQSPTRARTHSPQRPMPLPTFSPKLRNILSPSRPEYSQMHFSGSAKPLSSHRQCMWLVFIKCILALPPIVRAAARNLHSTHSFLAENSEIVGKKIEDPFPDPHPHPFPLILPVVAARRRIHSIQSRLFKHDDDDSEDVPNDIGFANTPIRRPRKDRISENAKQFSYSAFASLSTLASPSLASSLASTSSVTSPSTSASASISGSRSHARANAHVRVGGGVHIQVISDDDNDDNNDDTDNNPDKIVDNNDKRAPRDIKTTIATTVTTTPGSNDSLSRATSSASLPATAAACLPIHLTPAAKSLLADQHRAHTIQKKVALWLARRHERYLHEKADILHHVCVQISKTPCLPQYVRAFTIKVVRIQRWWRKFRAILRARARFLLEVWEIVSCKFRAELINFRDSVRGDMPIVKKTKIRELSVLDHKFVPPHILAAALREQEENVSGPNSGFGKNDGNIGFLGKPDSDAMHIRSHGVHHGAGMDVSTGLEEEFSTAIAVATNPKVKKNLEIILQYQSSPFLAGDVPAEANGGGSHSVCSSSAGGSNGGRGNCDTNATSSTTCSSPPATFSSSPPSSVPNRTTAPSACLPLSSFVTATAIAALPGHDATVDKDGDKDREQHAEKEKEKGKEIVREKSKRPAHLSLQKHSKVADEHNTDRRSQDLLRLMARKKDGWGENSRADGRRLPPIYIPYQAVAVKLREEYYKLQIEFLNTEKAMRGCDLRNEKIWDFASSTDVHMKKAEYDSYWTFVSGARGTPRKWYHLLNERIVREWIEQVILNVYKR